MRFGEGRGKKYPQIWGCRCQPGGCQGGCQWDRTCGLGTVQASKRFVGINEANVFSSFAYIFSCALQPHLLTPRHMCTVVCFLEEVSNNKILWFIRSSPKQQVYVRAERLTWGSGIHYGFGSHACDCAKTIHAVTVCRRNKSNASCCFHFFTFPPWFLLLLRFLLLMKYM